MIIGTLNPVSGQITPFKGRQPKPILATLRAEQKPKRKAKTAKN